MTRIMAMLLAVGAFLVGVAADSPARQASGSVTTAPSPGTSFILWQANPEGRGNPEAAIPNPGTGTGNSSLPAACRDITTPPYPGGVKPVAALAPVPVSGPGAVSARAFEVTGTGKFPVWQWAEVIQGRGFLLEIRIPDQAVSPVEGTIPADPGAALETIAANAYRRAAATLTPGSPGRLIMGLPGRR